MNIIQAILNDFLIYFKPTTLAGVIRLVVLFLFIGTTSYFLFHSPNEASETKDDAVREVSVEAIGQFGSEGGLSLIGTVEAIDQATIQAEVGGRVTAVQTSLGSTIRRGEVIATLENATQYATLLQAEGVYESALASAAQSDISVSSAQTSHVSARNNAVSVFRSAYSTANSAIVNKIDTFFTNPDAQTTPGLRIDGYGYTAYLNSERIAFRTMLSSWREEANLLSAEANLQTSLTTAEERTKRVIEMVDTFIVLLNDQKPPYSFTTTELATYSSSFSSLRAELNATVVAIENARTTLESAEEALARAQISGTGGAVSSADASIKQALGSLRSAQASYNKTILRSPITGEVQSLSVKTGDYIPAFTTVALVANQNALEITTYVSTDDRERIAVGDKVRIEGKFDGTITAIAPAVSSNTGKIEVRIQSQSEELQNGDTVELTIETKTVSSTTSNETPLLIPITALKVETDRIVVFTVSTENILEAHKVTEGPLLGDSIVITEGVTRGMTIVTDARGLNEGDNVRIKR